MRMQILEIAQDSITCGVIGITHFNTLCIVNYNTLSFSELRNMPKMKLSWNYARYGYTEFEYFGAPGHILTFCVVPRIHQLRLVLIRDSRDLAGYLYYQGCPFT